MVKEAKSKVAKQNVRAGGDDVVDTRGLNITSEVKESDSKYFRGLKSPDELKKEEKINPNNY